jgi:hypothetical protein
MANTYLTRTFSAGNRKTWTWSAWIKVAQTSGAQRLFLGHNNTAPSTQINIEIAYSSDDVRFTTYNYDGAATNYILQTNRLLRDTSGWYHLVVSTDTTQATASDRLKMYVNGVQETSFSQSTYPSQNFDTQMNNNSAIAQVSGGGTPASPFNGSMSHIHFIDGTAYDATAFGEFDANGVWKINTSPSVTYGTNGFFILKNGNSVTDQSGNGNNFTVAGGTLTKTEDSPSNVFATLNPLNANIGATIPTLSMGNNRTSNSIINKMQTQYSTIAPSTGKFYCEVKATAGSVFRIGISSYNSNQAQGSSDTQNRPGQFSEGWGYDKTGTVYKNESSVGSYTAYNTGDIICIALDMTNKKLYFKRDANAWENSANPATGSNGIDISSIPSGTGMAFGAGLESGSVGAAYADFNFGNGYFGTTAVSSAGTNASGIGIFEYDVPTGFTALSTKGLNL